MTKLAFVASATLVLSLFPAVAQAGKPDPEPFFQRLESIGLETKTIRSLTSTLTLVFRDPTDDKEAEYGYIRKRMYLPTEIKEKDSDRIRFDLPANNIDTLLHEFTHAYDFRMASGKATSGTDERKFWDAWNAIKADIALNPKEQILGGLARYPGMKASEVCGYFIGDSYMDVFDTAQSIVLYNEVMTRYIKAPGDADRLGDKLILPSKQGAKSWETNLANAQFGKKRMDGNAVFSGKNVSWPEDRGFVKQDLFQSALGLHPPKNADELLQRMNTIDNAWIRDVRKRVRAARLKAEQKLAPAPAEAAPGDDDLRNR